MANGGPPEGRNTVASSGCGLCSLCNVVNALTVKHLFVEDCVCLSEENGANMGKGLFCNGGHFISIVSYSDGEFCILDTGYTPEKFDAEERRDKVNTDNAPFLYGNAELLHSQTRERPIKYYLFSRKR